MYCECECDAHTSLLRTRLISLTCCLLQWPKKKQHSPQYIHHSCRSLNTKVQRFSFTVPHDESLSWYLLVAPMTYSLSWGLLTTTFCCSPCLTGLQTKENVNQKTKQNGINTQSCFFCSMILFFSPITCNPPFLKSIPDSHKLTETQLLWHFLQFAGQQSHNSTC